MSRRQSLARRLGTQIADHPKLSSPLQAIVLGLVIQRPSHGYEIANRCEHICGSFLCVRHASIYGVLERLMTLGLIEALDPQQARRGPGLRRRFRATAEGGTEYRRWAATEPAREAERAELLGRVATAGRLGTPAIRRILDGYERLLEHRAQTLAAAQSLDASHPSVEGLCQRLLLAERRIALAGAEEWLAVAREEVDQFEARHARDGE